MSAQTEILRSLLWELNRFNSSVEFLVRGNCASIAAARDHIQDVEAQLVKRSKGRRKPLRENRSFLP